MPLRKSVLRAQLLVGDGTPSYVRTEFLHEKWISMRRMKKVSGINNARKQSGPDRNFRSEPASNRAAPVA